MNEHPQRGEVGEVIAGRYRLLRPIGEGGMGVVWAAEHVELGVTLAIKLMRRTDGVWISRFRREARAAAQLRSRHIIQVYDYGVDDGVPYLVMELLEGETLEARIRREGALTPALTLSILRQVCRGLDRAHAARLVHRDLKPGNVFLIGGEDPPRVKVFDFGVVKALDPVADDTPVTEVGLTVGTPQYMSPEQATGEPDVDHRADLWAVGLLAHECLCGERPFSAPSMGALVLQICVWPLPVPSALYAVPDGFDAWFAKALDRERETRFQSASEAIAALEEVLVGPDAPRSVTRPLRRVTQPPAATLPGQPSPPSPGEASGLGQIRSNLRAGSDAFVGRRDELQKLTTLVERGRGVVSLVGAGGMGKTRLAQEWGTQNLARFSGGIWFCGLAQATSRDDVLTAIALALEVPLGRLGPEAQIGHALRGRGPLFLILDNCERVRVEVAALIRRWSSWAPEAVVLATSRERLRLEEEAVVTVGPLDMADAVGLFCRRAEESSPGFVAEGPQGRMVEDIVERLDRLPLAIELAAARLATISLERLADRLSQRFRLLRQRGGQAVDRRATMRGAIDWSWSMLSGPERLALAQASVFRGGFTLDAGDAVLALDGFVDAPWPEEAVEDLVGRSLIRVSYPDGTQPRFDLLETIRAYAEEKLEDAASVVGPDGAPLTGVMAAARVRRRHRTHYGRYGRPEHVDRLDLGQSGIHRRAVRAELANLEHGLRTGVSDGDLEGAGLNWVGAWCGVYALVGPFDVAAERARAVRDAGALDQGLAVYLMRHETAAWRLSGQNIETRAAVDSALEGARVTGQRRLEGRLLAEKALMHWHMGALDVAEPLCESAIEIHREVGDRRDEGTSLGVLAGIQMHRGHRDRARALYAEALGVAREVGDRRSEGNFVANAALLAYDAGLLDVAKRGYEHALAIHREVGNRRSEAIVLGNLAGADRLTGDPAAARRGIERALALHREVGNRQDEGNTLGNLGNLLLELGETNQGERTLEEGIAICVEAGSPAASAFRASLGVVKAKRGDFETARALIDGAVAALRGVRAVEVGKALVKRHIVERMAGDTVAAEGALQAAEDIAAQVGAAPASELGREIAAQRGRERAGD